MALLNTNIKIWVKILTGSLQSLAEILLKSEKTCAFKWWTIQSKLRLISAILVGVKDDEQTALINLN